jgi:hypothetical protein
VHGRGRIVPVEAKVNVRGRVRDAGH